MSTLRAFSHSMYLILVDNSSRHLYPNQFLCYCLVTDVLLFTTC